MDASRRGSARNDPTARAARAAPTVVAVLALCAVALALAGPAAATSHRLPANAASEYAVDLFERLNDERAARGLPVLAWDDTLAGFAGAHAEWMSDNNRFEHSTSPLRYPAEGENIRRGTITSGRAHTGWMQSDGHRRNILNPLFEAVGVAVVCDRDGRMWGVQNFARFSDVPQPPPHVPVPPLDPVARGVEDGFVCADYDPARVTAVNLAVDISGQRIPAGQKARLAVLSRNDAFPDSLAGTALTKDGPMLFTATGALTHVTRDELLRVLDPGSTVYLLGGTSAIGAGVEAALRALGFDPVRLSGPSRVETALRIADEVRRLNPGVTDIGVARAFGVDHDVTSGWADSVTGGAWAANTGTPIVLVPTDRQHSAVAQWLAANRPGRSTVLGGTAAVSDAVLGTLPGPVRVAGRERTETATRVALELWSPASAYTIVNGHHPNGWMHGLAAAGLAADRDAPLLLVHHDLPGTTRSLVEVCPRPQLVVVGDTSVVSEPVRTTLAVLTAGC